VRIHHVELITLTYPYSADEAWSWSGGTYGGWHLTVVRVTADDDSTGIGEVGDGLAAPEVVRAVIDRLGPSIVGMDPRRMRMAVARLRQAAPTWARRGLAASIISGIEAALFDLVAKHAGLPVHVLLGGARWERLPVYASGGLSPDLDALTPELQGYVKDGYEAVKIRLGHGLRTDVEAVREARKILGPDRRLMVDLGAPYLPKPPQLVDVARLARELEPFDPYWLEEPLLPEDVIGHAQLRRRTSIPIAAGENSRTREEAVTLLDADAVDVLQTDVVYVGGMVEQLTVSTLASRRGVAMAPHTWGSAPGLMANLHAAFCMENPLIVEYSQALNPLRSILLADPLEVQDGHVQLPARPGLGVELTDEIIANHPFDPAVGVHHRL
jgi:L-alanine-DL-glutamate epimerase-like enolase superfamily enzyme